MSGTSITPVPTTAQLALMNKAWSQTNINQTNTPGTIGMYGTADVYYFYMTFTANPSDLWHDGATQAKKFRILFQMGGQQSNWTGLWKNIDTAQASGSKLALDKISVTNSVKTQGASQIDSQSRDNSSFAGYLEFTTTNAVTTTTVYMNRIIEREEQTTTDESVVRIEAGRSLKGTYYTREGTGISFTTELQAALYGVECSVGLIIASCAMMLSF